MASSHLCYWNLQYFWTCYSICKHNIYAFNASNWITDTLRIQLWSQLWKWILNATVDHNAHAFPQSLENAFSTKSSTPQLSHTTQMLQSLSRHFLMHLSTNDALVSFWFCDLMYIDYSNMHYENKIKIEFLSNPFFERHVCQRKWHLALNYSRNLWEKTLSLRDIWSRLNQMAPISSRLTARVLISWHCLSLTLFQNAQPCAQKAKQMACRLKVSASSTCSILAVMHTLSFS